MRSFVSQMTYKTIDEAISVLQEAVEARPESNRYRSDLLNNLSTTFATRLRMTDQLLDLREAMTRRYYLRQLNYFSFATDFFNSLNSHVG